MLSSCDKPFERVVLALQRNEQRVGCGEHVQRDQSERRRTVDEDVIVARRDCRDSAFRISRSRSRRSTSSTSAPARSGVAGSTSRCLNWTLRMMASAIGRVADQDVVDGRRRLVRLDADAARRVALGVAVDEERPLFGGGEAGGEIDGGRRLSDAALLVRDRDDAGHVGMVAE